MRIRIIIADDERPAREFLKRLLAEIPDAEIIGEAENGAEAISLINQLKPDLALLDMQMPEMTGLEAVRAVANENLPLVAFVTAFDEFAVQAFELNAIDYLLKPVESERLRETIRRATARLQKEGWQRKEADRITEADAVYKSAIAHRPLQRIPVKRNDDIFLLPVANLVSIKADGELLHLRTSDGQKFSINFRLKDLEARLDPALFVRLSRSAIVKIDAVERISPMPGGTFEVRLKNGEIHSTSRNQSKILRARLLQL
ncbi:MAG: hypothetical protein C4325_04240 [Blastocatellia bacterium]